MIGRRAFLLAMPASSVSAAASGFRYAICNETFEGQSFAEACRLARSTGYAGLEIAPATLAADPVSVTLPARRQLRRMMDSEGLQYAGLHSLMPANPGLHLTTPDEAIRARSWEFFRRLIDLSGDLGGGVMALGSGKQRAAISGSTPADARKRLRDGLAGSAGHARERGVLLLLEPLSPQFTNVVNTLAEAVFLVRDINHPAVSSMFDTHNTTAETEPHDRLIHRYVREIRHVHVNEMDGRHPGTGSYDFRRVLRALREAGYGGWVSVEVFQFRPSAEVIAREAMAFLRRMESEVSTSRLTAPRPRPFSGCIWERRHAGATRRSRTRQRHRA
ncbi:MAG TPA: sugar phosphate isomerase/epimerase family protein [Bryobacteraceae bacterium]|nr:sugar phosphate isomerase/epimerase family protein [Bryobacteraceae bacterium]